MTEPNRQSKEQLELTWIGTIKLREAVLNWAKETGFSASELVSRTAEHSIETIYGRKVLEDKIE